MTDQQLDPETDKMAEAVMDQAGNVRPIHRIEFEVVDAAAGKVRFTLWERHAGRTATRWRMAYAGMTRAEDLSGSLAFTKMLLIAQQVQAHQGEANYG